MSFIFGGTGSRTAYAWARDAAGNVSLSANQAVTVRVATSTAVASDMNPSTYGQPVTFTATITPNTAGGFVQFYVDNVAFGALSAVSNTGTARASVSTSALPAGTRTVRAEYLGDANHIPSGSSDLLQTVNKANQSINFGALASRTYGDAPFALGATATSALSVSYSILSGPATVLGNTVTITGVGTVTVRASQAGDSNWNAATPIDQSFTVNPKPLTVSGITASNRVYDGTTGATLGGSGILNGIVGTDVVSLAGSASGTFGDKNVGTGKTVTITGLSLTGADAGKYTLTQPITTANITAATLTVTGITANNKVYDGTTAATLSGSASLNGAIGGDNVNLTGSAVGAFGDKNIGTGKTVTISGLSLSGTDAGNYALPGTATTTAEITAKALTVTGLTAANKTYDGNTTASLSGSATLNGVVGGDTVNLSGSATGAFGNKNVGTGKIVTITGLGLSGTDNGNYTLSTITTTTADITAKTLTVSGITVSDKTYDGTADATVTVSGTLNGVVGGDTVNLAGTATATFSDKNVGTGKTVTISGLSLSGADAANYTVAPITTTANIVARTVTVTGLAAANKTYDGTTAATLSGTATLNNTIAGDAISLTGTAAGTFDTRNVASGKTVTIGGLGLAGGDAGNYALAAVTTTANITAKSLTVTGLSAASKTYDGNTAAVLSGTATLNGVVGGDSVSLSGSATGAFSDKNVGTGKTVTIGGVSLSGGDAGNYALAAITATADITAKTLTVSGMTVSDKTYDGTVAATLTVSGTLNGVVAGDTVTLAGTATATFSDKNVGTGKTVSITGLAVTGTDAGNYTVAPVSATANIIAKTLTASGLTATTKVYDGTTTATLSGTAALTGVVAGDAVSVSGTAVGAFADKNAGTGKSVAITGLSLSGTDAGNYTLTQPTTTANITAKALTVSGLTAANKVYDGNTSATLGGTAALNGAVGGDAVSHAGTETGSFSDRNVGTGKTVTIGGLSLTGGDAGNYTLSAISTTANITPATLTVTANAQTKVYGAADPALTYSQSGLVGGDTAAVIAGSLSRLAGENVGSYAIQQGSLAAGTNYTISFAGASLTITKATLTVTADNKVRFEKAANPALTATYSGYVNGDTAAALTGSPALSTTATSTSATGTYPITAVAGTLSAANYTFNFVPGTLTVIPIGDITGSTGSPDGVFNIADVLKYLRLALHLDASPAAMAGFDLAPVVGGVPQGDGRLNIGDVVAALEHLVALW